MILQTIGSESVICTKSSDAAAAAARASSIDTMPTCSPSAPIRRTSLASISSLMVARLLLPFCLIAISPLLF
jgi:hypothetical protein